MGIITLTTDFGLTDWFVGTMKGVILGLAPRVTLIDITHGIPPGDIRAGAFALLNAFNFFPPNTIHLVVVDPGVGSRRKPLAIRSGRHFFVGPDNGVLSLAVLRAGRPSAFCIENPRCALPHQSATFHGRDRFAPAAAHLARGTKISQLGARVARFEQLAWPTPNLQGRVQGEVVCVDGFGNAITNLPNHLASSAITHLRAGSRRTLIPIRSHYQDAPEGHPLAVAGSTGALEIAINNGNAACHLNLRVGSKVRGVNAR